MTRPVPRHIDTIANRKQPVNRLNYRRALVAAMLTLTLAAAGCSTVPSDVAGGTDLVAATEAATGSSDTTSSPTSASAPSEETDTATTENQESHATEDDLVYDASAVVEISLDGGSASSDSASVDIDGSTVTITSEGVYSLSGTITDGGVVIDGADTDDVMLLLNGVDITNTDGAAIAVLEADEVVIMLVDSTSNSLTDGTA